MPFTEDLTVFFEETEFAHEATVNGTTVMGVFDREYFESLDIQGFAPVFTCAAADVADVVDGGEYYIDGRTYLQTRQEPDGTGVVAVILRAA